MASWTAPRDWTDDEDIGQTIMNAHVRDNLRYLKGLDGVVTTESGLIIDNTGGDEYLLLPSLTTAERNALTAVNGMIVYNETTTALNAYQNDAWGLIGVTDHGGLAGLLDDDHTIYLLADGTRNLTGNLTVSASVTIDGIDISAHDIATTAVHGAGAYTLLHTGDVDDIPVNAATTAPVSSNWAYDLGVTTKEPTGFPNITDTSTPTLSTATVTLAKTGASFDFYIKGVKYTKTVNQTVSLPNGDATDIGTWYIAFNEAGTLTATKTTSWDIVAADSCPVAVLYFNGTAGRICDERHGTVMSAATHDLLHYTVGTRYQSGLTGTFTDPANIEVALGIIHDEDLEYAIDAQTQCIPFYHASEVYTFAVAQNAYVVEVEGVLQYDNLTDLIDVTNNQYVAYWVFATMDTVTPIWVMPGQREDNLLQNARDLNKYESLSLGTLPFPEMKLLYRVIVKRSGTDEVYTETQDLRTVSNLPSGTYVATDHAALTGLLDDDHTQYFLLAGETTAAQLHSGADLIVYSDAGSTEVARIDGATGAITTSSTVDGVDIAAHLTTTTGIHGVGGSTIASVGNISTHADLITGVHGLLITADKTFTLTNSLTLSGTDASTLNIGTGGTLGTAAYTATTAYEASGAIATHASDVDAHVVGATAGQLLVATAATTAAWQNTGVTLTSPTINGTIATSGLILPAITLSGAVAGGDQSFTNVGDLTFATGSILKSGSTNTNTLLIAANDTTFITLTTGDTDTMALGAHTSGAINGLTLTASTGTFTLTNGKTLSVSNTLTLTATDSATLAIGAGGTLGSAAYTATTAYEASGAISTHADDADAHGEPVVTCDTNSATADDKAFSIVGGEGIDTSGATTVVTIAGEAASDTNAGIVELATINETNTGTSTTLAVTPDGLEDWTGSAQIATLGTVTSGTISTGAVIADVTMTLGADADGDVYYRASNKLTKLAKGAATEVLTMNAGGTAPEWAAAGGDGATKEFFVPITFGSQGGTFTFTGKYPVVELNGDNEYAFGSFFVPADFTSITTAEVLAIARAAQANGDIDLYSEYHASGEAYTTHQESDEASTFAMTDTQGFVMDISGILSSLSAGDRVGILIRQSAAGHDLDVLGIHFKYA